MWGDGWSVAMSAVPPLASVPPVDVICRGRGDGGGAECIVGCLSHCSRLKRAAPTPSPPLPALFHLRSGGAPSYGGGGGGFSALRGIPPPIIKSEPPAPRPPPRKKRRLCTAAGLQTATGPRLSCPVLCQPPAIGYRRLYSNRFLGSAHRDHRVPSHAVRFLIWLTSASVP